MNVQTVFKTIFIMLCTIACIVILGLILASLYLLLQVAMVIFPACLIIMAIFFLTQLIYFKRRINALKHTQAANLFMPEFSQHTGQWHWKMEGAQLNLYADAGTARFLGLLAGIPSIWLFLIGLNKNGAFNKQVWWFLGQVSKVPGEVSMILASVLLGLAVIIALIEFNPISIFKGLLARNADFFVSMEDRLNLEQANDLFKMAMQYYMQAKQEIQSATNLSLAMELEQIHQALISENLSSLIQNRKWQEFRAIAEGIIADLQRLKLNAGSTGWQTNFWQNETEEEKACRILGVSPNASDDEIRKAYRKLALLWHPDRNGGNGEIMKDINWAYDVLKNKRQFA